MEDSSEEFSSVPYTFTFTKVNVSLILCLVGSATLTESFRKSRIPKHVRHQLDNIKGFLLLTTTVMSFLMLIGGFIPIDTTIGLNRKILFVYFLTSTGAATYPPMLPDDYVSFATGMISLVLSANKNWDPLTLAGIQSLLGGFCAFFHLSRLTPFAPHFISYKDAMQYVKLLLNIDPFRSWNERFDTWTGLHFDVRVVLTCTLLLVSSLLPRGLLTLTITALCACDYYRMFLAVFLELNVARVMSLEECKLEIFCLLMGCSWCLVSCFCQIHGMNSSTLPPTFSPLLSSAKYINFTLGTGSVYYVRLQFQDWFITYVKDAADWSDDDEALDYACTYLEAFNKVFRAFDEIIVFFQFSLNVDAGSIFYRDQDGSEDAPTGQLLKWAYISYSFSVLRYITLRVEEWPWEWGRRDLLMLATNIGLASLILNFEGRLFSIADKDQLAEGKEVLVLLFVYQAIRAWMWVTISSPLELAFDELGNYFSRVGNVPDRRLPVVEEVEEDVRIESRLDHRPSVSEDKELNEDEQVGNRSDLMLAVLLEVHELEWSSDSDVSSGYDALK